MADSLMRLPARLVFPGGGIFFWWQAGAITSLSKRIDLSTVPCSGASAGGAPQNSRHPPHKPPGSQAAPTHRFQHRPFCMRAGALAATLAACDVDMDLALERALALCDESGALDRGAWGLCLSRNQARYGRPEPPKTADWLRPVIAPRAV